ncbi:DUF3099 domain-containing protein [Nocardiopsis sp. CT-R113]|uniref:DUF3099 domain-containing protein n=1 Tax=Nocardiopsis codii TaxID=3065942 RepID=A0ABU7KEK3_9ACTN|nr:DUF3099 domain-containing protein [Nocardiopsis sp. CT-R113]MEE2040671.1 DUF3099 domain-containing protein [Nocardiopsis sp. CT-R113]
MRRRVWQYSVLMGTCLVLFAGSLPVYYLFGTGWAVAMCAVASVLPPVAATLGNLADPDDPQDRDVRFGPNADTDGEAGDGGPPGDADGGEDGGPGRDGGPP